MKHEIKMRFRTWKELLKKMAELDDKGVECEVKGFADMQQNILTVYEIKEDKDVREGDCRNQQED